ncbi:ABC transporter permease subunit [Crenalkalicoccus roseus]|uniref:ABC transporter permease subunit n=1 Tax=Crenalkalicoccus roseus TaxID=1485588 RepID=UPI00108082FE|nr:ABC transporter permease subunit [Crenalkalicoccus roseus]
MRGRPGLAPLALGALLALAAQEPVAGRVWAGLGREGEAFPSPRLLDLAAAHAALAVLSALAAAAIGLGLGLLVTRRAGRGLRPAADALAAGAQAVPPVVVVALAFPVLGFGLAPTALALLLYCVMPVLRGTVAAIESVPPATREAAEAMGFTPLQVLREVELPLAWPVILAALRVALVLAVATAAVGALAGAATLGTPIILGLQNRNELHILQGAAATAALALLAEGALLLLAGRARVGRSGASQETAG